MFQGRQSEPSTQKQEHLQCVTLNQETGKQDLTPRKKPVSRNRVRNVRVDRVSKQLFENIYYNMKEKMENISQRELLKG